MSAETIIFLRLTSITYINHFYTYLNKNQPWKSFDFYLVFFFF